MSALPVSQSDEFPVDWNAMMIYQYMRKPRGLGEAPFYVDQGEFIRLDTRWIKIFSLGDYSKIGISKTVLKTLEEILSKLQKGQDSYKSKITQKTLGDSVKWVNCFDFGAFVLGSEYLKPSAPTPNVQWKPGSGLEEAARALEKIEEERLYGEISRLAHSIIGHPK